MRIEHKLPPAARAAAEAGIKELNELRTRYLAALGMAKEFEMRVETVRAAIGQQLAIIQETEGLPQPLAPYQLSADGSLMIGEIPDTPPAAAAADIVRVSNGAKGDV